MKQALVNLRNVSFSYGPDRPVLNGANLHLHEGERLGLAGPNGSGKTTLLHLIVGLLRPESGEVEVFGKTPRSEKEFWEIRVRAGLLFQDSEDQLFCPTVEEDVAFGPLNLGKSHSEARLIVQETLAELGLAGYERRITHKLSGGEKRLVSLAAVLAMKPEVLLLDEPTCGLDEDTQERIMQILSSLPLSMITISHDRHFLKTVSDRIVHLHSGAILPGAGSPECCCSEPHSH